MPFHHFKDKVERTLAPHLDAITLQVNKVIDKMEAKSADVFKDDKAMEQVFRTVHDSLPFFARAAVRVETFIEFCMKHRERFVKRDEKHEGGENRLLDDAKDDDGRRPTERD